MNHFLIFLVENLRNRFLETKTPNGFYAYVRKDAHKLIEEFMLLGNVAVAEKIHRTFPDLAFLRCHPPPNQEASEKLVKDMEAHGISIDTASSKTLANSLTKIVTEVSCKLFYS